MRIRVGALRAGLAAVAMMGAASAEQPGKEWKKCQSSSGTTETFYFPPGGINDFVTVSTSATTCDGPKKQKRTFRTASVSKGGAYSPSQYDRIVPYSMTESFVLREDGRWATYRLGEGEVAGAPLHADLQQLKPLGDCPMPDRRVNRLPRATVSLGAPDAQGRREGAIYRDSKPPVVLKGLGGAGIAQPLMQHDNMIVARWTDDGGAERSRIYNLGGEPLSPVVGKVERWALRAIALENYNVCNYTEELNLFIVGPALDRDPRDDMFGHLLTPIGANGAPVALPEGAAGVFPVLSYPYSKVTSSNWGGWRWTLAWGVVFPHEEGFEFTMSGGSLARAIADAQTGLRYQEITRLGEGWDEWDRTFMKNATIMGRTDDGKWRGRSYIKFSAVGAPGETEEAAETNAYNAFRDAEFEERRQYYARGAQTYTAALDAGTGCTLPPPLGFERSVVERHARTCPQNYGLTERNWLRDMGYPQDIQRAVDYAMERAAQKAAAEHAEMVANAALLVPPGGWETALRLGGDAWVKQIQGRGQNWLAQRQAEYQADWNRSQRAY